MLSVCDDCTLMVIDVDARLLNCNADGVLAYPIPFVEPTDPPDWIESWAVDGVLRAIAAGLRAGAAVAGSSPRSSASSTRAWALDLD